MTYSSGRSRRASKTRAYRSSTRPALAANSGSRRKIHDRVCHGLIASSRSQRQIVVADASVTPRSMTSRCSSVREKRPSGSPCVAGNSHAIALTSATCCGGKTARATRARLVLKPIQPIVEEAPSPLPHDPGGRIQPRGDLGIGNTRGGVQHDPRPLNLLPRPLLSPRHPRQLAALTLAELDLVTGRARHRSITSPCPPQLLHRFRLELADGSTSEAFGPLLGHGSARNFTSTSDKSVHLQAGKGTGATGLEPATSGVTRQRKRAVAVSVAKRPASAPRRLRVIRPGVRPAADRAHRM